MKHRLRDTIGAVLVGGFLASLGLLFFIAIPQANEQLITYMLGQLSGFAASIVAFHYASNAQSQQATENTGRAFEAISAAARGGGGDPEALRPGDEVELRRPEA